MEKNNLGHKIKIHIYLYLFKLMKTDLCSFQEMSADEAKVSEYFG